VLYLVIQAYRPGIEQSMEHLAVDPSGRQSMLLVSLGGLARSILTLLPGFVAGFISTNRGIIVGFAVGVSGAILAPLVIGPLSGVSVVDQLSGFFGYWDFNLIMALTSGLFAATAGAAGQLVRSNKSLERTRER
jgi:hypothetical protein